MLRASRSAASPSARRARAVVDVLAAEALPRLGVGLERALVFAQRGLELEGVGVAHALGHHPTAEKLVVALLVPARVVERHPGGLGRQTRALHVLGAQAGLGRLHLRPEGLHGGARPLDLGREHVAVDVEHRFELPQALLGPHEVGRGLVAQRRELALVENGEDLARHGRAALVGQ